VPVRNDGDPDAREKLGRVGAGDGEFGANERQSVVTPMPSRLVVVKE
jgi:hypothetical protein